MSIQSMYLSSKGISSLLDGETFSTADLEIQHSQHYYIVCIVKPDTVWHSCRSHTNVHSVIAAHY